MKIRINSLADVKHIVYAFIIVAVVGMALQGGTEFSNLACAFAGAAAAEMALFSKEFYDKIIKKKFFDWADIILGQIGVVAAFLCVWQLM